MASRRSSRELALQVLFQQEFAPHQNIEGALSSLRQSFDVPADVAEYALNVLKGVESNRKTIDEMIQKSSAHWTLKRMAVVDLNIMRIAVYEIKFGGEVPPAVAMDEAIEISKKFGTVDSAAFVNGILDQIVKQ